MSCNSDSIALRSKRNEHRKPAGPVARRALIADATFTALEDRLAYARDDLATAIGRAISRAGASAAIDAIREGPENFDCISCAFEIFDAEVDRTLRAFRREIALETAP
jgi:hypothetical protein